MTSVENRILIEDTICRYASSIDSANPDHTSYQKFEGDDDVCLPVGRHHDELVLDEGTWKISRLVFGITWGERRADAAGYLESVGGRGPQVPLWP